MDMDVKRIPCTGLKAMLGYLLQQLPSLSPVVAASRLIRKIFELMEKTQEQEEFLHIRHA
jgi:hypothetical protein